MSLERWRAYKKSDAHSYAFGPYPAFRLLETVPERCIQVLLSDGFKEEEKVRALCEHHSIPVEIAPRAIARIAPQATRMAAVFRKETGRAKDDLQLVLDRVDDMGNLGTIMRCMLAFGVRNLCLIGPCCDHFDPRVIRASMGAFFQLHISSFPDFSTWREQFPARQASALMLREDAEELRPALSSMNSDTLRSLSLILGNEGSGLGDEYLDPSVLPLIIPQSSEVDSLNLAEAAGIALYEWAQQLRTIS